MTIYLCSSSEAAWFHLFVFLCFVENQTFGLLKIQIELCSYKLYVSVKDLQLKLFYSSVPSKLYDRKLMLKIDLSKCV